jgi:hypothetical protein
MDLGFSCFGNTNCDIDFDRTTPPEITLPEIKIDPDLAQVEKPSVKNPVIQDTFVAQVPPPSPTDSTIVEQKQAKTPTTVEQEKPISTDIFQPSSNNQSTPTIFQTYNIDWSKVEWQVSDISIGAFKADNTYSAKFIENDAALKLAFAAPDKSFTGIFKSDKFQGYVIDDGKWSYNELKDFEKKLTDLDTKGQLTTEQKKGLDSLRKETAQIEAIVMKNMESSLNIEPDSIIDLRLKNGGQGFYDDLTKLSKTVKEQEARNSAAEIASENIFANDLLTGKNDAEKRIYELADKLHKDEYSSEEARKKDREEFFELYHQLGEAKQDGLEADGVIDKIMKNEKNIKAITEGYSKDTKEFLNRLEELQKLEKSGKISATERETLRNMEKEKETILELQEKLKNNPEEAYKLHKEITLAFARAGNYEKAAAMSNGESTALDRAEAMNRAAKTDKEKEAAKVYTNVLLSDPILREKNKVNSKDIDSWIKLKGDLYKVQQEYGLSNDVTAGIRSEMRSLYTDENTYNRYYDNSSSSYYSNYENSEVRPGSPEFHALSQAEKDAALGTLNTKIAEKDAIEKLVKDLGIPQNIAVAIVTNNTSFLQAKAQDMPIEVASKYLNLAGLNVATPNTRSNYVNNFIGLTIS